MYLKSLEIHGFKSFPEKTVLKFDSGATVIVGPNGSGKSNITDAMRWVLGELSSKNIRGTKMEDVIFAGADGMKPMSFAEVSVTFDDSDQPKRLNSPYDEITVTRRYYRAGESEYYINRKHARLKDIYELFMNTGIGRDGYSIIGQGKIAEIISKKSDERRGVFEESAGISKYRYKKQESEKKLEETEANMLRVSDILTELESRVGPLERAAQKARRYLELYEIKKQSDVSLWLYEMEENKKEAGILESECAMSAHELEIAKDTESSLENQSERVFEISQKNKADEAKIYNDIKLIREKLHSTENEYKILENNSMHADRASETAIEKSAAAEERRRAEEISLNLLREELDLRTKAAAETEGKLREAVALKESTACEIEEYSLELSKLLLQQKEIDETERQLSVRLDVLKNQEQDQARRGDSVVNEIKKYEEERELLLSDKDSAASSVDSYRGLIDEAAAEEARLSEQLHALNSEIEINRKKASEKSAEKSSLESRISALSRIEEHFEGYNNSVKFVMNACKEGKLTGICGPISQLIRVDGEYACAVESVLGAGLQNIVVENEEAAKAAIRALKAAGAGRTTFYPVTSVKGHDNSKDLYNPEKYSGFIGYMSSLVRTDEKYSRIISFLLGRVYLFDNLDNANRFAKGAGWKVRCVTLDGQQINSGGSFTGGSVRRDSGMLTRASQIDKLSASLKDILKQLEEVSSLISSLEEKYKNISSQKYASAEKIRLTDALLRTEVAQLEEINARLSVNEELLYNLRLDAGRLSEDNRAGTEEIASIEKELLICRGNISDIIDKRSALDIKRQAVADSAEELGDTISALMVRLAENKKDVEAQEKAVDDSLLRIRTYSDEAEAYIRESEQLKENSKDAKHSIELMKSSCAELRAELDRLEGERTRLEANSVEYEKKLNDIRLKLKETTAKKELLLSAHSKNENKLSRVNDNIDKMTSRFWDEYELTHSTALLLGYPAVNSENRAEVRRTLEETKSSIRSLGGVNVDSIEEYKEVKERYDFVKTQMDDLEVSKNELRGIISSIEHEMERMFIEAFEKINSNFGEVFRELFGGGHAELVLTDPENVLTSGIEINAAPPGKMIKSLSLLSGGEQAFIAIALLFALIKVNPAPFCIFDEIEAALDEANVARAANYIKKYSSSMQIIMITHRRGTMEIADTLYGVTMPRRGVSRVLVLDVNSAAKNDVLDKNTIN